MTPARTATAPVGGSAQPTVRRLVVYVLLFALVVIAAAGLAGLLGRLLLSGTGFAGSDVAGLARSLAFTLIGGPLAAVLWRALWKRLDDEAERTSLAWGLYLAAVYVVSLITAASGLLSAAASLFDVREQGPGWRLSLATGVVWAGVWAWHRWMWRHPAKRPVRLAEVPAVAGWVYGLAVGTGAAAAALAGLLQAAVDSFTDAVGVGTPWWVATAQALVWAAGAGALWWWHWVRDDVRHLRTDLADVALVVVGVMAAGLAAVAGAGTALFVVLRLAFDRTDPARALLAPLDVGVAAGILGLLVWVYHRAIAAERPGATALAAKLAVSGVGLAAAASGLGVIVNSALALGTSTLAGPGPRTLLLGGISFLLVGGSVWWAAWRPTAPTAPAEPAGRRIYLVVVFGISAVVALVALLVIGYRVFEFLLDDVARGTLVDRVRAPLGLLVATGLAAGYHFVVWRHDRALLAAQAPARRKTIDRVVLVTGADPGPLSRAIKDATGAEVTVWPRADTPAAGQAAGPDAEALARALDGVAGRRVLVLAGPGARIDVVPLAD